MFKFFSNTVLTYLESDLNNFIQNTSCVVHNTLYSAVENDGEIVHYVLIFYTTPTE